MDESNDIQPITDEERNQFATELAGLTSTLPPEEIGELTELIGKTSTLLDGQMIRTCGQARKHRQLLKAARVQVELADEGGNLPPSGIAAVRAPGKPLPKAKRSYSSDPGKAAKLLELEKVKGEWKKAVNDAKLSAAQWAEFVRHKHQAFVEARIRITGR